MTRKQKSRKRSAAHLDDDMVDLPGVHRHEDALRVRPLKHCRSFPARPVISSSRAHCSMNYRR